MHGDQNTGCYAGSVNSGHRLVDDDGIGPPRPLLISESVVICFIVGGLCVSSHHAGLLLVLSGPLRLVSFPGGSSPLCPFHPLKGNVRLNYVSIHTHLNLSTGQETHAVVFFGQTDTSLVNAVSVLDN